MLDGRITISLNRDKVGIELECKNANIAFLELEMDPAEFTAALGRLAARPCKFKLTNTQNVGKKYEYQKFSFDMVLTSYGEKRQEEAKQKALELCPEGWQINTYFNSNNSFDYQGKDNLYTVKTSIYRWVDEE